MTLSRPSKCALCLLSAASSIVLAVPFGCGSDDSKNKGRTASGGGSSIFTSAGNTSVGNGGTAQDASGGETSVEIPAGTGGASVSTTTLADVACASDVECKTLGLMCDMSAKKCVECRNASDCTDGKACVAGLCGAAGGCVKNDDCASSPKGKVCDAARGRCVACVAASECPDPTKSECVAQTCVTFTSCGKSTECPGTEVCDPAINRCVECYISADCNLEGKTGLVCANNHCQTGCSSNDQCTGSNKFCNTKATEAYCAGCLENSDCAAEQYCSKGSCVADVCVASADQACISGGIATCNETGDGFGNPKTCPETAPCTVIESRASCGKVVACTESSASPCTTIPQFTATQVVDGDGNDLCSVPAFKLAFDDSAGKINQTEGETGSTTSYQERATFRVAWSATHVHAYIEVADSSVNANTNPADIWNGDAVEFMISTSRNVTGLTSADANTLHVIGNSVIGVTVKASGESGSHTQIHDPNQFKAKTTANGYAIEVMLPWPAGAPMAAGTQIYFDAALNSASKNNDGTAPRKAQALLFQADAPASTTCTGTGTNIAPFCDDRLWCPTQTQ